MGTLCEAAAAMREAEGRTALQLGTSIHTQLEQHQPHTTLENHPMQPNTLKVETMPDPANPDVTVVTLTLDDTTLNPAHYDDWLEAAHYLRTVSRTPKEENDNYKVWVDWSRQAPAYKDTSMDVFAKKWLSLEPTTAFAETLADLRDTLAPEPLGTAWPTPPDSFRAEHAIKRDTPANAIATILDQNTAERCGQLYIENVAKLQQELTDLISPKPEPAQLVLEAKGHTLIDLVQLGLLSDEDMANHLADCAASLSGQPFSAKRIMDILHGLRGLQDLVYGLNVKAGWWADLETGEPVVRNKGELMMMIVGEVSEAHEGVRKNLMDAKLKTRPMEEVEIGDVVMRSFDYTGAHQLDIGGAILHKLLFNQLRADHTREHRLGVNGKKT